MDLKHSIYNVTLPVEMVILPASIWEYTPLMHNIH